MPQSCIDLVLERAALSAGQRVLVITPGKRGAQLLATLLPRLAAQSAVVLETDVRRLKSVVKPAAPVLGRATRLPFFKHSFDAILSFETLFAVRPPWTTIAEFHRVLVADGKLILVEPQSIGFFSSMRDSISGPGKRVFPIDEIKYRLARADWELQDVRESVQTSEFPRAIYAVTAIKKENAVEPVPQYTTAKELIERRKNFPKGDQLP